MHSVESSFVQNDCKNTDDISDWTVLYYMAGDVSGMHKWTTPLIENLTMVKSSDNVNIVVFHDGFEKDDFSLFYIDENGKRIDLTSDFGWPKEVDSSSLTTLEEFCTQMMNAYTANHYALIPIVSGGTGWQLFCLHDAHDGNVGVSIPAFAASLQRITDETNASIDVLYTSCAMNMVEVV
jgi:hypothetical protein